MVQRPAAGSQSGADAGQSLLCWHCTHSWLTGSQRGVAPEHVVSSLHAPHTCSEQMGPAGELAQLVSARAEIMTGQRLVVDSGGFR